MESKVCSSCKELKPVDQFYVRKDNGKYSGICKPCRQKQSSTYYAVNTDKHRKLTAEYYQSRGRFQRYGLDEAKYRSLLAKQGGVCGLCGTLEPGGKGKWHIDHIHTGVDPAHSFKLCDEEHVRGLLCHRCNISLGHYEKLKESVGEEKILSYLGLKHESE